MVLTMINPLLISRKRLQSAEKTPASVSGRMKDNRRWVGRKAYHAATKAGTAQINNPNNDA
jgi:hypothetical protein